jgi:heme oxygenase (mycobilin-producing)
MKLYITYGTVDYLAKLVKSHKEKNLLLMANNDTGVLFHETEDTSIFKEPKTYEVIDSTGVLINGAYAVLNNIPVSYEGRPLFEKRFSDLARLIEKKPGFTAIRVLKPVKSDTYIILTLWENEQYFNAWQESKAYDMAHPKSSAYKGQPFPRPSYVTKYSSVEIEDQ